MMDQKQGHIPVYWWNELIGHIANLKVDMFHQYGDWFPQDIEAYKLLMEILERDSDNGVLVGLNENKPTHYISIESFSPVNGKTSIDLILILDPPHDW